MPGTTTTFPQVERNIPAQRSSGSASKVAPKDKTKEKTFMDKWVEPPVATQASYQDHGAPAYGVLEHMQPLGEPPSAKVKQRVKGDGSRKSVLGRSSAAVGGEVLSTPEGTPAPGAMTPLPTEPPLTQPIVIDDEKDDDYAPTKNGKKKERNARPRAVKRKSEPSESAPPAPAPPSAGASKKKAATHKRQAQYEYDGDKLKRVVDAAKLRAVEVGKPDLANAVNEIYVQSLEDQRLRALLEAILTQNATPEQNLEFQEYVKAAKKKLKDAKHKARQQSGTNGPRDAQQLVHSPEKKLTLQPAPTSIPPEAAIAIPSTERLEPPKPKISLKVKSPSKDPNRHRSGNHKMSLSPRKRSGSAGSDSSLTSLTSNEDDGEELDTPPPPSRSFAGSSSRVNGFQGRDHAAERGTLAVPGPSTKRSSADAELADERDRHMAAKKQKFTEGLAREYDYTESSIRPPPLPQPRSRVQRVRDGALAPPSMKLDPHGSRANSVRGSRAVSMDLDSPLSDLSPANSRQNTPKIGRPLPRPAGKKAKTKQSPEKRQLAASSAMPGVGGAGRDSPIGDDDNETRSENNDFCSACRGGGYLLCCDGCDRSFHFECLDPPISDEAKELNEPWYCYICVAKKPLAAESSEKKEPLGLFGPLLAKLKKFNPKNFELPEDVRNHFEGTGADRNGSFMDAVSGKPTRNRPGYSDDQPDYYKLRDSKGYLVLCYACGHSSQHGGGGKRAIVTCDHCTQHWHLDCLDPPLANPPALNKDGKKVHDWMCPLHIDQAMRSVDTSSLNRQNRRKVHVRKSRNPKVADTALRRGLRNNGIIEVLEDDSDGSDSEFYEFEESDKVYKLPTIGIKLDFIDKVKDTRIQQLRDERAHKLLQMQVDAVVPSALEQANFAKRPFNEKQLALNLAQFASDNQDLDLGHDQVENLVGALIAEAPSVVVDEMMAAEEAEKTKTASSAVPPSPPASEQTAEVTLEQRKELQMLQELIRRKLDSSKT